MSTVSKAWLKSTTIWGLLAVGIGMVLDKFGLPVDLAENIVDNIGELLEVAGLLVAAYGRSKATGPLSGVA